MDKQIRFSEKVASMVFFDHEFRGISFSRIMKYQYGAQDWGWSWCASTRGSYLRETGSLAKVVGIV